MLFGTHLTANSVSGLPRHGTPVMAQGAGLVSIPLIASDRQIGRSRVFSPKSVITRLFCSTSLMSHENRFERLP